MVGTALLNLADIAACMNGDFHTMHLNVHGVEFDELHRKVLSRYYVEAGSDYDEWAEQAMMFDDITYVPNKNGAATRISWSSFEGDCVRDTVIARTTEIIKAYVEALHLLYQSVNQLTADIKCVGVANALQSRIEFWNKEVAYFNARRY